MPFQMSPGISITEKDLTTVVPNVSTTIGGIVGQFAWGPANERVRITSENELVALFGEPTSDNYEYFWPAANYLGYGNNLLVVRGIEETARNSAVKADGTAGTTDLIENGDDYDGTSFSNDTLFYAKYPGALGDSLEIYAIDRHGWEADLTGAGDEAALAIQSKFKATFTSSPMTSEDATNSGGVDDEMHIMVIDKKGEIAKVAGDIIETHAFVSKASDAKRVDGSNNYVVNVLRNESQYVYAGTLTQFNVLNNGASDTAVGGIKTSTFSSLNDPLKGAIGGQLAGGNNGAALTGTNLTNGYDLFDNAETVDVTLLMQGGSAGHATNANNDATSIALQVGKHIVGIAEQRKDCVAFVSPRLQTVVGQADNTTIMTEIAKDKAQLGSSSYGVMDSAWKYQYDRYRDVFVNVPMNGDIAGLCARTDFSNDPWYSPAGVSRGTIKNIVKPSWHARKADRDELYKLSINPMATRIGQGVQLFGDKTMLQRPSAFDRINVRRLFIVLEKTISIAARNLLFEMNDPFTRSQFVNIVAPFLREVQGRRGITDYKVVCDTTNNTGQIIDTNRFVGDIYVKPTRSINFIQLNFVATRTDVSFTEVGA